MTKAKWADLAEEAREIVGQVNDLLLEAQGGVVDGNDPLEDLRDSRSELRRTCKVLTRAISKCRKSQEGRTK